MPTQSISEWLQSAGFAQYMQAFADNDIDLEVAESLSDQDLKELGVSSMGHRKKLLKAISQLSEPAATPPSKTAQAGNIEPAERRQLTVLFCDMVGFTELASRLDPEDLQKIVRSYEDTCAAAITRYEGYVYQRLGDGIVAFFGYPLAHEGEAERAIRAGLDIIDALSSLDVPEVEQLCVRIGVATGMVVVASAEKGAVGETMNLASRLQGIAPVNTVVVSERVKRLAAGVFDYEDLGEQTLKGISALTHAYRILGISETTSRFAAAHEQTQLTPLVGRDLELALLMDRWARAQGEEGQVVLLSGDPGIGKSRILSALGERLDSEGAKSLRFQCSPYYMNSALWPSIDNFERALRFTRDESPESKLDKLESLIVGHYERPLADVRFIASMLSIACDERYGVVSMTPQKFKDETLRTLVDLTEAAARKQPSVLFFEDTHWADPTTLEVLDLLVDRVRTIPLLIALTHRPEFQNRWADHGHVSALDLVKLTRAQSSAMVSNLTQNKALPPDLLEEILVKTDGVPLFVEELTKSILESGELKEEADRYAYTGTSHHVTIPATLRDSLMARLDRYARVKEIAQIGAAIGREFSYELIAAVAPLPYTQLDEALSQLTDSGLAFRRGTPPEAIYTFKHALVQDAAYDSLLKSTRQELHAKIGRVIEEKFPDIEETEPVVLAHHYTEAGLKEKAISYWWKAGDLAQQRVALEEGIHYYERGLALVKELRPSDSSETHELKARALLGMSYIGLYGYTHPQVTATLKPALALKKALTSGGDYTLRVLWGLWVSTMCSGQAERSLQWVDRLISTAEQQNSQNMRHAGHWAGCNAHLFLGNFERCAYHADNILANYDPDRDRQIANLISHDPKTIALAYKANAEWCLGYVDRALASGEAAISNARHWNHYFDLCWVSSFLSHTFFANLGQADKIGSLLDEAEQIAAKQKVLFFRDIYCPLGRACWLLRSDRMNEAETQLGDAIVKWSGAGMQICVPMLNVFHAEAMLGNGHTDSALRLLDKAEEQIGRPGHGERSALSEVLRIRGRALAMEGKLQRAEEEVRRSLMVAEDLKAKSFELRSATDLARLLYRKGQKDEGLRIVKPVYDWFSEGFDTKDLKEAKALLDELSA